MAQSLSRIIVHLIFSTRERIPFIQPADQPRLHAYLASVCRTAGGHVWNVGGTSDHVHVATDLPRTMAVADLVRELKTVSSRWMKRECGSPKFEWQRGYGAFSVSKTHLPAVIEYIEKQEEHHRKTTFQQEYLKFLKRYQVDYDERYVWN